MNNIFKGIVYSDTPECLEGISSSTSVTAYLVSNAYKKYVTMTSNHTDGHWVLSLSKNLTNNMPIGNYSLNVLDGATNNAKMICFIEDYARVINSARAFGEHGNTEITEQ